MYESHFGLSAPPFQLNPDPAFYYGSRGHANALAYLKFGIYQGEGFIVVTGEIGAGKTTLVRTLLESLDTDKVIAAQVVSTQLSGDDLLRSILNAFGVPGPRETKAQMLGLVEAFLTSLAAQGKRALIVVDEAQNLPLSTIEELRMLSNFQIGHQALLQSFLVGQPELRALLESPQMEQLRQRVIASCHLGPLNLAETRAYVEHRLTHVGWTGRPAFDAAAFEEIHRWTSGIPRRINLLCSRLMLGAFLEGAERVDLALVGRTAAELRGEVGASTQEFSPAVRGVPMATPRTGEVTVPAAAPPVASRAAPSGWSEWTARPTRAGGPLLLLAASPLEAWMALRLRDALRARAGTPDTVLVTLGESAWPADAGTWSDWPAAEREALPEGPSASLIEAFEAVLVRRDPVALLCTGRDAALAMCAQRAVALQLPLVRLDAGLHGGPDDDGDRWSRSLDALADLALAGTHPLPPPVMQRDGLSAMRVAASGHLALESLAALAPRLADPEVRAGAARAARGGGLVCVRFDGATTPDLVSRWIDLLCVMAADTPLTWLTDAATRERLAQAGHDLTDAGITLVGTSSWLARLAHLSQAAWLVHDGRDGAALEAFAWDVPALRLCPRRAGARVVGERQALGGLSSAGAIRWAREVSRRERRPNLPSAGAGDEVLARVAAELLRRTAGGTWQVTPPARELQAAG